MVVRLTSSSNHELSVIGGKAAGLVRLMAAGLQVPEAWVISAPTSLDRNARERCLTEELPGWWRVVSADFAGDCWAVRSSAVAEDLAESSFAGVYQTILGVGSIERLVEAVQACWSAWDSDRAQAYRGHVDESNEDAVAGGIAVVLQRMVRADTAGVMLTENPLQPFGDEVLIDASWGLGESVVSGVVDPDHIVLDRTSGEVLTTRMGRKQSEMVAQRAGGIFEREIAEDRRAMPCLTADNIADLHALARTIEGSIGERRDIEWAIERHQLFVLQDRPITGLPPRDPKKVWTRRFGDEYLAEYVSPLGNDLMIPWLIEPNMNEVAELQGRRHLAEMTKVRRIDGYIFLNGDYAIELARAVPLADREGPLTAWFDSTWGDKVRTVKYRPSLLLRTLRTPRKDPGRGPIKANLAALDKHCARVEDEIIPLLRQDWEGLEDEELQRQLALVDELGRDHFRVIRWGMAQHAPIIHALLAKLLRSWTPEEPEGTFQALISGLPGTRTAEINRDVHGLGLQARRDQTLLDLLRSEASYDDIRAHSSHVAFWGAFDEFVLRHGHRSSSREISAERWLEQPSLVLGLVRAQVHPEEAPASPVTFEEAAAERRTQAQERVMQTAGHGIFGAVRQRILRKVLDLSQRYTVYRENQRYHLDYLLAHIHLLLLEMGRRLAQRGGLRQAEDVFLLTGDQLLELSSTAPGSIENPEVLDAVELARLHRETHSVRMPATFLFDEVPTEGRPDVLAEVPEGSIAGLAASAGVVTATCRAVPSLADLSTVRPGDILVASNIDPGWTSVFPIIAGLVTETGGVLSHGAILAREYGIPTVTCLPDAMAVLSTGTLAEVDGSRGLVRVLEKGAADLRAASPAKLMDKS